MKLNDPEREQSGRISDKNRSPLSHSGLTERILYSSGFSQRCCEPQKKIAAAVFVVVVLCFSFLFVNRQELLAPDLKLWIRPQRLCSQLKVISRQQTSLGARVVLPKDPASSQCRSKMGIAPRLTVFLFLVFYASSGWSDFLCYCACFVPFVFRSQMASHPKHDSPTPLYR